MRLWTRFTVISLLLILSLGGTVCAARATMGAVHSLSVQQSFTKAGDVRAIRPWMTIPYIAHTYQIPTNYLYASLGMQAKDKHINQTTLHTLATNAKKQDNTIVTSVQTAILHYRRLHRSQKQYTPMLKPSKQPGRVTQ